MLEVGGVRVGVMSRVCDVVVGLGMSAYAILAGVGVAGAAQLENRSAPKIK
jgi:hypothetical protein